MHLSICILSMNLIEICTVVHQNGYISWHLWGLVHFLKKAASAGLFVAVMLNNQLLGFEKFECLYLWMRKLHFYLQSQTAKLLRIMETDLSEQEVEKSKNQQ